MTDSIAVLTIMLIPTALSLGSQWLLDNRTAAKLVATISIAFSGLGIVAFASGSVSTKSLVAMMAPSFQVWLAHAMASHFRARQGRTLRLFAYETVQDPQHLADARYSAFYFVVSIALPLLSLAPFFGE